MGSRAQVGRTTDKRGWGIKDGKSKWRMEATFLNWNMFIFLDVGFCYVRNT